MNASTILLPVLVQITLTTIVFLLLGLRKTQAIKAGGVDREKTALDNSAWPEEVVKVSNNIANQFQTPVLFYVLSILFYVTDLVSLTVLALAWVYSISRIVHAFVHTNSNFVPLRFGLFIVGVICLMVMTVIAFINMPIY
ncbi:MAG: hypothetical protein COA74_06205 [Gammaproteobacteria bacterium]|nr:MAG: hypothetical protein COA74_14155 [Gammaproteobacteria bacterium]PCJ49154.1 MAG: hypothetical protein COA74_06205 [Gammaproteobacteria bacterium]